ncbi:hypothetical protein PG993_012561 [Apiospora rasikravindrae]|uniref:Uncharacterized protein n=1 Tax=Apiospora rasikravindrae TaxID=990691 RepID=A0ABR1S2R4_9PEZI
MFGIFSGDSRSRKNSATSEAESSANGAANGSTNETTLSQALSSAYSYGPGELSREPLPLGDSSPGSRGNPNRGWGSQRDTGVLPGAMPWSSDHPAAPAVKATKPATLATSIRLDLSRFPVQSPAATPAATLAMSVARPAIRRRPP